MRPPGCSVWCWNTSSVGFKTAVRWKHEAILSVNVFSTNLLIGDTIFTSPTGNGTAISIRDHPSHVKVHRINHVNQLILIAYICISL